MRKEIKRTIAFCMAFCMLFITPMQSVTALGETEFLPETSYGEMVETGSEYSEEVTEESEEVPEEIEETAEDGENEEIVEAETEPELLETVEEAGVLSMLSAAGVATASVITNDLYWVVDEGTLYITDSKNGFPQDVDNSNAEKVSSRAHYTEKSPAPWQAASGEITAVSVGSDAHPVRPYYTAEWFAGLDNLETIDLYGLDTTNVVDFSGMFRGCALVKDIDISNFHIEPENMPEISMSKMFKDCISLETLNLGGMGTGLVTDMSYMFSGCSHLYSLDVSKFDTSSLKTAKAMFENCSDLYSINTGGFDVSNVTDFSRMFAGCSSAAEIQVGGFNTVSGKDMSEMFSGCESVFELDLTNFNTSKVNYMDGMFRNCASVSTLDVSGFNTLSVTNMKEMFRGCASLMSINIDKFEITSVTTLSGMFRECIFLQSITLKHDMTTVTDLSDMFRDCTGLETVNIETLTTTAVKDVSGMFKGCDHLKTLSLIINTANAEKFDGMLEGCVRLQTFTKGASCRIDSKDEDPGTNVSGLPDPDDDYTFGADGYWYCFDDSSVVTRFKSSKLPTGTRGTYSAVYIIVTYMPNGYDCDPVYEAVTFGEAYQIRANPFPVSAPKQETFWNLRTDGSGAGYKELDVISADTTRSLRKTVLYAQWVNPVPGTHTVTWKNYDDSELLVQSDIPSGTYASYTGDTPLKPMDGLTAYIFKGWDKDPETTPILADTTFTADYEARNPGTVNITWLNDDGSWIADSSETYSAVFTPSYAVTGKPTPVKQNPEPGKNYTFIGWTPELKPLICDATYTATFSEEWADVLYWGLESSILTISTEEQADAKWRGSFSAGEKFSSSNPAPWMNFAETVYSVKVGTEASKVPAKVMDYWFAGLEYVQSIDLKGLDSSQAVSADHMFENCRLLRSLDLTGFSTASLESAEFMFSGCSGLNALDVTGFDTANLRSARGMFYCMTRLKKIDLSGFSFATMSDASSLFAYDTYLSEAKLPAKGSTTSPELADVSSMFSGCRSLTSIDLSGLELGNIVDAEFMFDGCSLIKQLDISGADLTNATKNGMLRGLNRLELLKVGAQGSVRGTGLATPSSAYVKGADGYWYSATDYQKYLSEELPENKADTYRALFAWIDYDSNGYGYEVKRSTVKSTDTLVGILGGSYMKVPGKIFSGWCLDPSGNGTIYAGGKSVDIETAKPLFGKTLYAVWKDPVVTTASVTWKNWDGEIIQREDYDIGDTPVYKGTTPTRPDDGQNSYEFEKWDPAITKVTGDAEYKAKYTAIPRMYSITWQNNNGVILATQSDVPYGTIPQYKGVTPTRAETEDERYVFIGWSPEPYEANKDQTYTARYRTEKKQPVQTYTIEWRNWDNTLLQTDPGLMTGELPSYKGKTPTRPSTEYYIYTFNGWDPKVELVSKNQTYKASFEKTKRTYIVSYDVNGHGTTPGANRVAVGDPVPNPGTLTATGFVFQGWYTNKAATVAWDFKTQMMPAQDMTLYAGWKEDTGGGGDTPGGGGGGSSSGGGNKTVKSISLNTGATFSEHWFADSSQKWHLNGPDGKLVTSMWVCDDAVAVNRCDIWYLLKADGTMEDAGLVQDATGNYYSLEMRHNGYYGMLRYVDGYYDGIYLEFEHEHNGSFGAIKNASGIEKLKAKYGVTKFTIGNDRILYTSSY